MEHKTSKLVRRSGIKEKDVGGELMLYDVFGKYVHVLNDTALFIWQRCDGEHSLDDIVTEAATIYDVSEEQIRLDIEECLETFRELSIIQD